MAIKFRAKSNEEIPSELQSLYVERDGAFVLDVEGAVDKAREWRRCAQVMSRWQVSSRGRNGGSRH